MRRHQEKIVFAVGLLALFLTAPAVRAADLRWISPVTVVVDGRFHFSKPSTTWDTQSKNIGGELFRLVNHREGANPIIRVLEDSAARGKTSSDYARTVRKDLELRGLRNITEDKRDVNGMTVYLFGGEDSSEGKLNYLVAAYADAALRVECSAGKNDFSFFHNEFMAAINSVKLVGR